MTGLKVATFRERFTELIHSCPKSRSEIAEEFGVAKQTISAWLTGQNSPRLPVVAALADYFNVNIEWLIGFDVPRVVPESDPVPEEPAEDPVVFPATPEARAIAAGVDVMPDEKRLQALRIMQAAFPEYSEHFREEDLHENNS